MSHSSYTSSERRGIIAIAMIVLLIIGGALCLTICTRTNIEGENIPKVVEYGELIDTVAMQEQMMKTSKKKVSRSKNKSKAKSKKTYRRRSPLDEPV